MVALKISDELLQKVLFKKSLTDNGYTLLLEEMFDSRWIDNKPLALLFKIAISYHKKYGNTPNKDIFTAVIDQQAKTESISSDEVKALYNECLNLPEYDDTQGKVIQENIFRFIKEKGIYFSILDNLEKIERKQDISDIVGTFSKFVNLSIDRNNGSEYFTNIEEHLKTLENPTARLPFGFKTIDYLSNGGMLADGKCLVVAYAQPGLGKSNWMANLAVNQMQMNKTPVIISLEMSEDIYRQRIDALVSGVDLRRLGKNTPGVFNGITEFKKRYPGANLFIKEYPPSTINCAVIENYLKRLKSSGIKFDSIIVDYINLLLPRRTTGTTMYERIGEVAKELRALSYAFDVPVITANQLNKASYAAEKPGMEHVSESSGINHHSDWIAAFFQGPEDKSKSRMGCVILKDRFGGSAGKVFSMNIDYKTLRLSDGGADVNDVDFQNLEDQIEKVANVDTL
jgi:replicative DNA helicase